MTTQERLNLVRSVADEIIEAASERDYCNSEGQGENFDRWNIESWVDEHLEELDLTEGEPLDWAEHFMESYNNVKSESVSPPSFWDKVKGMEVNKEDEEESESLQEEAVGGIPQDLILNSAGKCMNIDIWNLRKPVKAAPDVETFYECAVRCGKFYKGFENEAEASKWIKRNYLSTIYGI